MKTSHPPCGIYAATWRFSDDKQKKVGHDSDTPSLGDSGSNTPTCREPNTLPAQRRKCLPLMLLAGGTVLARPPTATPPLIAGQGNRPGILPGRITPYSSWSSS